MKHVYRTRAKAEKLEKARDMRKNPTATEKIMWEKVRRNRLGVSIRRQAIILGYIVDFWCPSKRLVIEIDGEIHETQKEYDKRRDKIISSLDIKILRFTNKQILTDLYSVISEIRKYL